jgi:hypothetical protein
VKFEKFEIACRELDSALKREKQAELLLNKQNAKLAEMANKLAKFSAAELKTFKAKQVTGE